MASHKCSFPEGLTIKPDGIHELDPCVYETIETYKNVTVEVRQCMKCGRTDIVWIRQEDTERVVNDNG